MGVINHNAIIATTWDHKDSEAKMKEFIASLPYGEQLLFVWRDSPYNGFTTVIMVPDGSKEGWGASDEIDNLRDRFVAAIESMKYEDGSNPWRWVEVGYGEYGQKILRGNNVNCYDDSEYHGSLL